MQFTIFAVSAIASLVAAMPANIAERQTAACTGTFGNALCCATDVLGLADLNCVQPTTLPANATQLQTECAAEGQQAKCCALPILGQALLCQDPINGGGLLSGVLSK